MSAKLVASGPRRILFHNRELVRTVSIWPRLTSAWRADVTRPWSKLQQAAPLKSTAAPSLPITIEIRDGYAWQTCNVFSSERLAFNDDVHRPDTAPERPSANANPSSGLTSTSILPVGELLAGSQSIFFAISSIAAEQLLVQAANKQTLPADDNFVDILEMVRHECPPSVSKEFADLFPDVDITGLKHASAVTMTRRTRNDMSSWSPVVEIERAELSIQFTNAAKQICAELQASGHWADFIDPDSGRSFFGPFTQATLFETDDRFRHLGVTVEDLGCCKAIVHPEWGYFAFVGVIFTSASIRFDGPQID